MVYKYGVSLTRITRSAAGKTWENHGKPWENHVGNHGKTMENHGKTWENMGKPGENIGKPWKNNGKSMGKLWEKRWKNIGYPQVPAVPCQGAKPKLLAAESVKGGVSCQRLGNR